MSHAHVCDECMTVAPVGAATGWWSLEAIDDGAGALLVGAQKSSYHFCSWKCTAGFLERMAPIFEGRAA